MNHWHFVLAAYAVTGFGTAGLFFMTIVGMRDAEKAVSSLEQ
jgi:hypothetical protein